MSIESSGGLQQTDKSEYVDPLFDLVSLASKLKCIGRPESNIQDTRELERRVEPLVALERMRCMSELDLLTSPNKSPTHEELKVQFTEDTSGGIFPTQKRRAKRFKRPTQNNPHKAPEDDTSQERQFAEIDLGDSEKIVEMLEKAGNKCKETAGEFSAPDWQSTIVNTSEVSELCNL
eukprot:TRINITY_DN1133_c0_g2_i7.p2 TRINITY_DN1133_c0_g2~~TRINITY_DN1133_c0_g2_i7.p2  ORF type:complete len:177 (-),score=39.01 TRINITY_DN1133_c0_g2_i7:937-1467(-)